MTAAVRAQTPTPRAPADPAGDSGERSTPVPLWDQAAAGMVAWRQGDPGALDRLVRLLTPTLWQVVRAYRLDTATAEDAVQNTWLALVRHRDTVQDPQAVLRWLTVTARREAWRLAQTAERSRATDDTVLDLRPAVDEGPEAAVVRRRRDEALWRAVGDLPERCQRLLRVVAFTERADYSALSRDLGMPVGSIGPTRGRCLAKLRQLLGAADWRTA